MFGREPVVGFVLGFEAVAVAVISLLSEFGVVVWSASQTAAVMGVVAAVASMLARRAVTPNGRVAELVEAAEAGGFDGSLADGVAVPDGWVSPAGMIVPDGWFDAESS
jgi:hypothetical protein